MRGKLVFAVFVAFAAAALLGGLNPTQAATFDPTQTNIMQYEGLLLTNNDNQVDYTNVQWTRDSSTCCAGLVPTTNLIQDNADFLGVPVELIGRTEEQSGTCGSGDATCQSKFAGTTLTGEVTDDSFALGAGLLITADFSGANLQADWQIVKLAIKQDGLNVGLFVATLPLHDPTGEPVQFAFIPDEVFAQYTSNGCPPLDGTGTGTGTTCSGALNFSHFTAFGSPTNAVPEPSLAVLLGLGLVSVGFVAQRKFAR